MIRQHTLRTADGGHVSFQPDPVRTSLNIVEGYLSAHFEASHHAFVPSSCTREHEDRGLPFSNPLTDVVVGYRMTLKRGGLSLVSLSVQGKVVKPRHVYAQHVLLWTVP